MNLIWRQYSLINFFFLFSICFAINPVTNWIDSNKEILSHEIKSASFRIDIESKISNQLNNDSIFGNICIADQNKFRIDLNNRTIVSDGDTWKIYDVLSNQLFIQNPDKKLEKLLFSWSKIKKLKKIPIKKVNNNEYKVYLFDKNNNVRIFFNDNKIENILINNEDSNTKISYISLHKESRINLLVGNIETEIFDLR
jgi:outer membrane lipoprotein-sorting protein